MFEFDLLKNDDFTVTKIGNKKLYNVDCEVSGQEWVKTKTKKMKTFDMPQVKSALHIKQKGYGKNVTDSLGYMYSDSNNVYKNSQGVCIVSSVFSHGHGVPIIKDNIYEVSSFFSARKMINFTWYGQYDEYMKPNESHIQFKQFKYDSVIYSIFNNHSQQSSLRQVEYKDKLWDIKNEFFWMSKDRMKELADENGYDNLYNDARTSSDRHVHNLLFGEERIYDKLSDDAKAVLDKATELVEQSLQMRQVMADDHNHLDSWDAGYAQLKLVWKEYFEEDFKEFRQLYKNLEDRMRPLVYELGFLMK